MGQRRYTREFKLSAVKLVNEQGYSVSQAAKSLGVALASLHCLRRFLSLICLHLDVAAATTCGPSCSLLEASPPVGSVVSVALVSPTPTQEGTPTPSTAVAKKTATIRPSTMRQGRRREIDPAVGRKLFMEDVFS